MKGKDFEKIKALFTNQQYEVHGYFNRKRSQILQTVKEYASKADSGHLICFLSSHGNETSLSCSAPHDEDERKVKIIEILKAADTEERKKNPKIFFIDACRGKSQVKKDIAVQDIPEPPGRRFVLGFSCLNLNSSFLGHDKSCGVYIETLIKVFTDGFWRKREEHAKVRDLQHFHKKVQRIFHKESSKPSKHPVQIPVLKSTVAGSVFLHHD